LKLAGNFIPSGEEPRERRTRTRERGECFREREEEREGAKENERK